MYNVATTSGDTLTIKQYDDNDKLLSTRKFSKKEVYSNIKGVSNADLTFEIKDEHHKVVFTLSQSNPTTAVNVKNKFGTAILVGTASAAFATWNNGEGFVNTGSYKVYTALLTQSGTNAPVATVLENTLGKEVSFQYIDIGVYFLITDGAFTANKTVVFMDRLYVETEEDINSFQSYVTDINTITIESHYNYVRSNNIFRNPISPTIEIRVYN